MEMLQSEKELLNQTHDMVKTLYHMILGSEDYKDGSIIKQLQEVQGEVKTLREDKIRRDATIKVIGFFSGAGGSVLGGLVVGVVMFYIKKT